jgi:hypothetical protein
METTVKRLRRLDNRRKVLAVRDTFLDRHAAISASLKALQRLLLNTLGSIVCHSANGSTRVMHLELAPGPSLAMWAIEGPTISGAMPALLARSADFLADEVGEFFASHVWREPDE